MATAFPAALDSFVNPTASSNMSDAPVLHHVQHANLNDAVRAMQVYIGTTGSVAATDLTGKLANAGIGATVQAGALVASTTAAPNATAVQTALSGKTDYGHGHNISVISGAQASLVSGSNIKTVNGYSLLGAGDLAFAGGGAVTSVTRVAESLAIPLNLVDPGSAMPLISGNSYTISTDSTITIAAGQVENGVCLVDFKIGAVLTLPAGAIFSGDALTPGFKYRVYFFIAAGDLCVVSSKGSAADVLAPFIGAPSVTGAARSTVVFPITELNTPTLNGTTAGVTLSGAAATGRTVTAVAVVGSNLNVTLNSPLVDTDVLSVALAAGMVKDASNNLSVAKSATPVINTIPAPLLRFATLISPLVESGDAVNPYLLTAAGLGRAYTSNFKMVNGVASHVRMRFDTVPAGVDHRLGLQVSTVQSSVPSTYDCLVGATGVTELTTRGGAVPEIWHLGASAAIGVTAMSVEQAGVVEWRISRSATNVMQAAVSVNGGTSWTDVGPSTTGPAVDYFISVSVGGGGAGTHVCSMRQANLVATP